MSKPEAPQGSTTARRLGRAVVALGGLLLLAVAGAVLFRQPLATRAAVAYLERQGVAVQSLTVTRLTPGGIEVRDAVLGTHRELTVARIAVTPAFDGLSVTVTKADIEGLRLQLDVTGRAPLFGSLQPAVDRLAGGGPDGEEGGDATAPVPPAETAFPTLPAVELTDAAIIFDTPSGAMTASLTGRLSPAADGALAADAALTLDSNLGHARAQLNGRRQADGSLQVTGEVADGHLAWQGFAVGAFSGQLSGESAGGRPPQLAAAFDLRDLSLTPPHGKPLALTSGRLSVNGSPDGGAATLNLEGGAEFLDLNATATAGPAGAERRAVTVSLQGEARSAGGLAQFIALPGPQVAAGTLVLQAAGSGSLPDGDGLPESFQMLAAALQQGRLTLQGDAILADVALADGTTGLSAHLPLVAEAAGDRLTLTLSADAAVRVEHPAAASLQRLGIPDDLRPLIASGLTLTLEAGGARPFRLAASPIWPPRTAEGAVTARGTSDQGLTLALASAGDASFGDGMALTGFRGSLDLGAAAERLSFGGREARGVAVDLPLTADYGAEKLDLALARPGALRIAQFGAGAPLHLQQPLAFAISDLGLESAPDGPGYAYRLAAREDGVALSLVAGNADPIAVDAKAVTLRVDGRFTPEAGHDTALALRLTGLALPGYDFAAEAVKVDVALDRELRPKASRFAVGPFQLGGADPLTAPLDLDGTLKRKGAGYEIAAEFGLSGGQTLADLTGRYGDDGTARVEAASRLLSFAPDGLQPAQLSPLLAGLENVRGTVTANASLAWPRAPATESAKLAVSGLSFGGPAEVEGLDLAVTLDSLLPLASAPGQRLGIRRLDVGIPVENIALAFSLDQAPGPRLSIEDGGFDLGGARWRIEPAVLDPGADRNRVVLATDALDLATFIALLGVDGLSGSGTLKGSLPIVFAEGDIIVDDGRFEALAPGRLSIRIDALRAALAGGGETVEMAVKAMEDFHYDNLSVTLAKTAANDATVRLSTLGQNPAVLDGQPFQFNINLESNLTSVLDALRQGYSLSDDALKRAWRLRQ